MGRGGKAFVVLVGLCAATSSGFAIDVSLKPVPSESEQATSEKAIRQLFASEYSAKQPGARAILAKSLLARANATEDDPVAKFVMLRDARDVAASAGEVRTALDAISAMAQLYDIDSGSMTATALAAASRKVASPADEVALVDGALDSAEGAIAHGNDRSIEKLVSAASSALYKIHDNPYVSKQRERVNELRSIGGEIANSSSIAARLKAHPDGPEDNLAMGRFLCFVKCDWEAGLPMLAKGSDEKLKDLAKRDAANPSAAADQVDMGDAWVEFGKRQLPHTRSACTAHGVKWYMLAMTGMSGIEKDALQKKIDDNTPGIQFSRIATAIQAGKHARTVEAGRQSVNFEQFSEKGEVLVGIVAQSTTFDDGIYVGAIQSIFLGPSGRQTAEQHGGGGPDKSNIEARKGYAVGGIVTRGSAHIECIKLIFMRVHGASLDPADAYESSWIGRKASTTTPDQTISGNGRIVIGVWGTSGSIVDGIGLVLAGDAPAPPAQPVTRN